jgi:hypothetical protein
MPEEAFADFMWDITVPGLGEVWLRGEGSSGIRTQTWLNGELLRREPRGEFAWSVTGEPTEIWLLERTSESADDTATKCSSIRGRVEGWERYALDDGYSEAFRVRHRAYAHYGRRLMNDLRCSR